MADPLTIVGGIAAVMQIAGALTQLSKELGFFFHTVRSAPQEIDQYHRDLTNFSNSMRMFYRGSKTWLQDLDESPEKEERKSHIASLIMECKAVKEGFEKLLDRYLVQDDAFGAFNRIQWYFRKRIVAGLRLLLESAKSSVMLFVMLQMCEDLQKKVDRLQKALQKVPRELKKELHSTKKALKEQTKVSQKAHKLLLEHVENAPVSDTPLIPDIRDVVYKAQKSERHTTRILRREGRRIKRESSYTPRRAQRSPSVSQSRSQSPTFGIVPSSLRPFTAARIYSLPRSNTRHVYTPDTATTESAIWDDAFSIPISLSPTSSRSNNSFADLQDLQYTSEEIVDEFTNEEEPSLRHTGSSVSSEAHSRSQPDAEQVLDPGPDSEPEPDPELEQEPELLPEPEIYGPIIHDDGNEIRERFGQWRARAESWKPAASTAGSIQGGGSGASFIASPSRVDDGQRKRRRRRECEKPKDREGKGERLVRAMMRMRNTHRRESQVLLGGYFLIGTMDGKEINDERIDKRAV